MVETIDCSAKIKQDVLGTHQSSEDTDCTLYWVHLSMEAKYRAYATKECQVEILSKWSQLSRQNHWRLQKHSCVEIGRCLCLLAKEAWCVLHQLHLRRQKDECCLQEHHQKDQTLWNAFGWRLVGTRIVDQTNSPHSKEQISSETRQVSASQGLVCPGCQLEKTVNLIRRVSIVPRGFTQQKCFFPIFPYHCRHAQVWRAHSLPKLRKWRGDCPSSRQKCQSEEDHHFIHTFNHRKPWKDIKKFMLVSLGAW